MNSTTIIGAGIVGLATALQLQKKYPDTKILVIEKEDDVSKHQTGNNSGVIHSGIYYKPGSLKAENCRRGYKYLLDFCDEHNIEYDICGKVIVATSDDEIPALNNIYERGIQNGLENLQKLSLGELKEKEPHVNGVAGIFVPQTGIIDFKAVSQKMKELIVNNGGEFKFSEEVKNIIQENGSVKVITNKYEYSSEKLISCAGLQSDRVAKMTNPKLPLRIVPFRGEYYELKPEKHHLVKTLIYPVPNPSFPFLGVHFTNMIGGGVEAGPNAVFSFKREGYTRTAFNLTDTIESLTWKGFQKVMTKYWKVGFGEFYRSFSKAAFVKALQKLIPEIQSDDLIPGGAGVRAQACDYEGGLVDDFYFVENENIIHVCNAPSPAATSSLAIGETIVNKI